MDQVVGWVALWIIATAAGVLACSALVWIVDRAIRAAYCVVAHIRWSPRRREG